MEQCQETPMLDDRVVVVGVVCFVGLSQQAIPNTAIGLVICLEQSKVVLVKV